MTISEDLRERIRAQAKNRCGYCLSSQQYLSYVLEIDHLKPVAAGGADDEFNLWLACPMCNRYKGTRITWRDPITDEFVPLFNPRFQIWEEHFQWSADGSIIIGLTPIGRATTITIALYLNHPTAVVARKAWVSVGWHPPSD